jgi:hypothetical protein
MTDAASSVPVTEGDFRVGRVLNQTASVWSRNFLVFSAVGVVIQLPSVLFSTGMPGRAGVGSVLSQLVSLVVGALLLVLLATLSEAVLVYAAFQDLRGLPVNLRESLQFGLRRFFPVLGLALAMFFSRFSEPFS